MNELAYTGTALFTITFMVGGVAYKTIQSRKIEFPETNPTKTYADFTGWYYEEEATNKASESTTISSDITLYAGWNEWGAWTPGSGITGSIPEYYNYIDDTENAPLYGDDDGDGIWYFVFTTGLDYGGIGKVCLAPRNGAQYELLSCEGTLAEYNPSLDENGDLVINNMPNGYGYSGYPNGYIDGRFAIEVTYTDGNKKIFNYSIIGNVACLAEGTEVTLADRTKKKIEDITYEDELLVWNFDKGCLTTAKPLFIKKRQEVGEYNLIKFEDGTELKTVIDHRIFNVDSQKFTYTMDEGETPIGTRVFKEDGTTTRLIERKVVQEKVNYYNIITDYHMNLFANGLLTSCRLNNLYEIKDMKFIKDNRKLVPREEFEEIPDKYFYGLRLAEQPKEINRGNDVKHTKTLAEYVKRLLPLAR